MTLSTIYRKVANERLRIKLRNIQYSIVHRLELNKVNFFRPDFSKPWQKTCCFILPSTKLSGGVAVVCEYANRLKERGVKVMMASLDGTTDLSWFGNQTVEVVPWYEQIDRIRREFDTVVATGWITAYEAAASNIPRAFYFVQSDERRFYPNESYLKKRVEDTYRLPFRYITLASWMQNWLKKEFRQESMLIKNGINTHIFNPNGPRIAPRPINKVRIVVEGAIDLPFKRVKETIQITNCLHRNKYEIWLVSSSGEPDPSWKIDRYFSCVPHMIMGNIYRSCHILLKLSTVEGMAGPPLEAMACGCIPIVQKVTGSDEYMIENKNGFVVENIEAVDEALIMKAHKLFLSTSLESNNYLLLTTQRFDWRRSSQNFYLYLGLGERNDITS